MNLLFKKFKILTIIITTILLISGDLSGADQDILDEKKIQEIVIKTIKENPALIYEVLSRYLKERKEKRDLQLAFKNRIRDIPIYEFNPKWGPSDAPLTIVEFSDFRCRYCKKANLTIKKIIESYPGKIRLIFKNNPFLSKLSFKAAMAAMAANEQGKFWEYKDLLFRYSNKLNEKLFIKIARDLNLDMERFEIDRHSERIKTEIEQDMKDAKRLKLNTVPVFIIDGVVIKGAKPLNFFKKVIDRLLVSCH